jgi:branched-chain amino acid transport system ATP-binding protein
MCSGLLRPSRGRVALDGTDVTTASTSRLARLGLCHVPEGRAIFPTLTVRENLRLLGPTGSPDSIDKACTAFPALGRRLGQLAGELSGGEQQMLALSRAHLCDPQYVLLDEVSMGLAPKVVDAIFEFLRQLADAGTALLIVEQYVAKALELADTAYVLHQGRITFCGAPADLDADAIARSYLGADPSP